MKNLNMSIHLFLMVSALLGFVHPLPQKSHLRLSDIDISSAQEINNLEPSAIPGIESRSFSTSNNGNYVEATVEEVQKILKSNPDLPRLTRGEILDLLENITRDDMEKLRRLNANRKGKAILLVMPYSAKRNGETMEDLYTKRPVTQLIDTDNSEQSTEEKTEKELTKPAVNSRNEIFRRSSFKAETTTPISPVEETPASSLSLPRATSTLRSVTYRPRTRPPRTRPSTTPKPSTTTRPFRRRRITTTTDIPITTYHNHRYSSENTNKFMPENAMRPTRPFVYRISRRTTTPKADLSVAESYVKNFYVKYDSKQDYQSHDQPVYPKYKGTITDIRDEINPDGVFKPLPTRWQVPTESSTASHEVAHHESVSINTELSKLNGNENSEPSPDEIIPDEQSTDSQKTKPPLRLSPEDYIIPDNLKYVIDDLELKPTLKKNNFMNEAMQRVTVFPRTSTTTTTELPITPMPEFKEVADNLSPEMKNLLMTFGLIPGKSDKQKTAPQTGYYPEKAEQNPESYTGFKPLPEDGETDKEMDALLASFGLGRSARKSRKIKKEIKNDEVVDFSVIPNSMIDIVQNLGLQKIPVGRVDQRSSHTTTETPPKRELLNTIHDNNVNESDADVLLMRRTDELSNSIEDDYTSSLKQENHTKTTENKNPEQNTTERANSEFLVFAESVNNTTESNIDSEALQTTKDTLTSVVFNPTDQKIVEHEKQQLDKLMELMKALKAINGSATEEDFKHIDLDTLKHFTEVLNNSQRLTLGEQMSMAEEEEKIHLASSEIVTVVPSETQNEIEADSQVLKESFGGLQTAEIETEPPGPKKLPSGFYYLIDWNTFLEVDDTKGRRVNLRFQPTVGDPSRFYSIHN